MGSSESSAATKAEPASTTWEHPWAELREELQRRPAAWVAALRTSAASADPLLVARIPAVHRKLTAAGVPHVLPLLAVERDGDRLVLVHRHEQGESLAHRLARGRLTIARTLAILRALCRSIAAAHRIGIEHRALGPASVLLGPHEPWITDFGVADLFAHERGDDDELDAPDLALHPMSPERARGEEGGAAEDVYLLGCLAYWMVAGVPPFAAVHLAELAQRHATEPARPLALLAAEPVPFALRDAVERAMRKRAADRFADVDALDRALAQAQVEVGIGDLRKAPRVQVLPPRTTNPFGTDPPRPMSRAQAMKLERLPATVLITPEDRAHLPPAPRIPAPERTDHEITATLPLPVVANRRLRIAAIALAVGAALALVVVPLTLDDEERTGWPRPPRAHADVAEVAPVTTARPLQAPVPAATPSEPSTTPALPTNDVPAIHEDPAPREEPAPRRIDRPTAPVREAVTDEPPAYASADCERVRKIAGDAREGHDWEGLLGAASRPACWADRDDAIALRIKALMELGRFAECASAVDRLAARSPELARTGELCRRRAAG